MLFILYNVAMRRQKDKGNIFCGVNTIACNDRMIALLRNVQHVCLIGRGASVVTTVDTLSFFYKKYVYKKPQAETIKKLRKS